MDNRIIINLGDFYSETAKIDQISDYIKHAFELAGEGNIIVVTGQAPIWMYLKIAHALHGKAKQLWYSSPATGDLLIFDHNAF